VRGKYLVAASGTIAVIIVFTALFYPPFQESITASTRNVSTSGGRGITTAAISLGGGGTTTSTSTSNASLDLSLVLQLSTVNSSIGNLTIRLSDVNLLNSTNVVPFADHWAYSVGALSERDGCAFGASLAFGIFTGNLSLSNYQAANPLPLYDTSVQFACTETVVPTSFTPLGNESVGLSTNGYWTGGLNTSTPAAFMTFPSGLYTVIGVDEWGQVLLLHFTVRGA
jgi:hypothetical protein